MLRQCFAISSLVLGALIPGRTDAASNVVQYSYDAVGSVVGIQRVNPAPIALSGFSPASGPPGTRVTITGTGFGATAAANAVSINGAAAAVVAASVTSLAVTVPENASTGRLAVTVAGNMVVSAQDFVVTPDFVVPPPGVAAADILAAIRLAPDGPARSIGLYATNKYGLVVFEGTGGAWLSLQLASFVITPASSTIGYTIYKPDGSPVAAGTLSATSLSIHLPVLPMAGTYSVLLRTGLAQVSLDARVETNRFLPVDGAPLAFARSAGQSTRTLIAGISGEQKALMVSGLATTPASSPLDVQTLLPNGSMFRRASAAGLGTTTPLAPFTVTGTYPVLLIPPAGTTQAAYRVALVRGAELQVDGPPADVVIANPGEGGRLTFAGVAGESLGLGVSGVALHPAPSVGVGVAAYKPDGTLLISTVCGADGTACAANLENLPVTGTYTVILQPVNGHTGTQRVWLSRDVGATLVSGTPSGVALSRPGQNARLTFAATGGALLALQVRAVVTTPPGQGLLAVVKQPDKSTLAYTHLTGAGQTLVTPPLPTTGTYTVFIEPEPAAQAAATATMEVLLDPGRALDIDGPPQTQAIGVAGGSARFLFSATAGQSLGLGLNNLVLAPATGATASIYKPDGTQLAAYSCAAGSPGCSGGNLLDLPATGTYGIVVRPLIGATGSVTATLSSDLAGALLVGGAPFALNLERPGRNARLVFAGTAGQSVRLSWSGATTVAGHTYLTVISPAGSTLAMTSVPSNGAGTYDIPVFPATGNYTLFVDPPTAASVSATVGLTPR